MVSASLSIVWKRPSHLGSTGRLRLPLPAVTGGPKLSCSWRMSSWSESWPGCTPLRERKLSRAGHGSCKDKWLSLACSQNASLLSKEETGLRKAQCPLFSYSPVRENHLPRLTERLEAWRREYNQKSSWQQLYMLAVLTPLLPLSQPCCAYPASHSHPTQELSLLDWTRPRGQATGVAVA